MYRHTLRVPAGPSSYVFPHPALECSPSAVNCICGSVGYCFKIRPNGGVSVRKDLLGLIWFKGSEKTNHRYESAILKPVCFICLVWLFLLFHRKAHCSSLWGKMLKRKLLTWPMSYFCTSSGLLWCQISVFQNLTVGSPDLWRDAMKIILILPYETWFLTQCKMSINKQTHNTESVFINCFLVTQSLHSFYYECTVYHIHNHQNYVDMCSYIQKRSQWPF